MDEEAQKRIREENQKLRRVSKKRVASSAASDSERRKRVAASSKGSSKTRTTDRSEEPAKQRVTTSSDIISRDEDRKVPKAIRTSANAVGLDERPTTRVPEVISSGAEERTIKPLVFI